MTNLEKYGAFLTDLKGLLPANRFVPLSVRRFCRKHHLDRRPFQLLIELGAIQTNGKERVKMRYQGTTQLHQLTALELVQLLNVSPHHKAKFLKPDQLDGSGAVSTGDELIVTGPPIEELIEVRQEAFPPVELVVSIEIRYENKLLQLKMPRAEWRHILDQLL